MIFVVSMTTLVVLFLGFVSIVLTALRNQRLQHERESLTQQLKTYTDSTEALIAVFVAAYTNRPLETLTPGPAVGPAVVVQDLIDDELDYQIAEDHSNVLLDLEDNYDNADAMLSNLLQVTGTGPVGP